jgi:hypothetical protein
LYRHPGSSRGPAIHSKVDRHECRTVDTSSVNIAHRLELVEDLAIFDEAVRNVVEQRHHL